MEGDWSCFKQISLVFLWCDPSNGVHGEGLQEVYGGPLADAKILFDCAEEDNNDDDNNNNEGQQTTTMKMTIKENIEEIVHQLIIERLTNNSTQGDPHLAADFVHQADNLGFKLYSSRTKRYKLDSPYRFMVYLKRAVQERQTTTIIVAFDVDEIYFDPTQDVIDYRNFTHFRMGRPFPVDADNIPSPPVNAYDDDEYDDDEYYDDDGYHYGDTDPTPPNNETESASVESLAASLEQAFLDTPDDDAAESIPSIDDETKLSESDEDMDAGQIVARLLEVYDEKDQESLEKPLATIENIDEEQPSNDGGSCHCWHCTQLKNGISKRFCQLDDTTWIQDESVCGAGNKCQIKICRIKAEPLDAQRFCLFCGMACHEDCLDVLMPNDVMLDVCDRCLSEHSDVWEGMPQGFSKAREEQFLAKKEDALLLVSPEEFDGRIRQVHAFCGAGDDEDFGKYDDFILQMDKVLAYLGKFGAWFVDKGKERGNAIDKRGCWIVTVPFGGLTDVYWCFDPDMMHSFPPGQQWPASIGMCWTSEMDFGEYRYLMEFCDPSYQVPLFIACRARSSKEEVIVKGRICSDIEQIPTDHNPAYPKWQAYNLSYQASRISKMKRTTAEALPDCIFYPAICFHCYKPMEDGADFKCDRCNYARYCSQECFELCYQSHKRECKTRLKEREQAKLFCKDQKDHLIPMERSGNQCNACHKTDENLIACECKGLKYCSESCFKSEWRAHTYWCYLDQLEKEDIKHEDDDEVSEAEVEDDHKTIIDTNTADQIINDEWKVCWRCEKVFPVSDTANCPFQVCLKVYCSKQCAKRDHENGCDQTENVYSIEYTSAIERHFLILDEHREQLARERSRNAKNGRRGTKAK